MIQGGMGFLALLFLKPLYFSRYANVFAKHIKRFFFINYRKHFDCLCHRYSFRFLICSTASSLSLPEKKQKKH